MKNTEDLLIVDAGNMLFKTQNMTSLQQDEWLLKSELLLKIEGEIGLDAINVGVRDLTNGLSYLSERSEKYKMPFVSSNLVYTKTQKPAFNEFVIVDVSGIKIGILGVTEGINPKPNDVDWEVKDYKTIVPQIVKKLKDQDCEIILLLANVGKEQIEKVIKENTDINFAVISGNQEQTSTQIAGETIVFRTKDRGRSIGIAEIGKSKKSPEKMFVDLTPTELAYKQALEKLEKNLGGSPEQIKKEAETLLAKIEDSRKNKNFYKTELLDVDTKFADKKEVKTQIDVVTKKVADFAQQQKLVQGIDPNKLFVGQAKCAECHAKQYNFWVETSHAKAYQTLVKENKQFSVDCVGCHVTGWEENGGFSNPYQVDNLKDVQCESCHGAGKAHLLTSREDVDAKRKTITKVPAESSCVKCHTKEQTEGFKFPVHKQLIACPSGK
ncbi:hypothetical protein IT568_12660 [bacterium]|nr:hypothetical protein [bacterium]